MLLLLAGWRLHSTGGWASEAQRLEHGSWPATACLHPAACLAFPLPPIELPPLISSVHHACRAHARTLMPIRPRPHACTRMHPRPHADVPTPTPPHPYPAVQIVDSGLNESRRFLMGMTAVLVFLYFGLVSVWASD